MTELVPRRRHAAGAPRAVDGAGALSDALFVRSPRFAPELIDSLVIVLDAVRQEAALTRPEIAEVTGLGRNVVADRVHQLIRAGLVADAAKAASTGGRAPRGLRFRSEAGCVLVAELGATSIETAAADLSGRLTHHRSEPADITDGPEAILDRVTRLLDETASQLPPEAKLWGVGVGLPGPVEFRTGRPVSPPIMPGWDGYDVRARLRDHFAVPVWVDNEVNVMALGEFRSGAAAGHNDLIFVKVGTGIGAGLVSGGQLHRGYQGCAGDIGHIATGSSDVVCRCGQRGCLEAQAGGFALAREGIAAARDGSSPLLARLLGDGADITAETVIYAAHRGDPVARGLVTASAHLVGDALAGLVNFFNPSLVLIGGGVATAGDFYLAEIRQTVLARSLPLATRSLQILPSPLADRAGLRGAAFMVVDALLSADWLTTPR